MKKHTTRKFWHSALLLILITVCESTVFAQGIQIPVGQAYGLQYLRRNTHNGNKVKTVINNAGLLADGANRPAAAWPVETNPYIFDLNVFILLEKVFQDTIVVSTTDTTKGTRIINGQEGTRSVDLNVAIKPGTIVSRFTFNGKSAVFVSDTSQYVTSHPSPRGNNKSGTSEFWGITPYDGFSNSNQDKLAMSHLPQTWPLSWPDQPTWKDPSTGKAQWNGYFGRGVINADQESYFVASDGKDKQWYNSYGYQPNTSVDATRYGAGLDLTVRGLQWANFLAQDNIFFLYTVKNTSTSNYNKVLFGSVVGTAVGGDGQTQYNISAFDQSRAITYTYQDNPSHVAGSWNNNFPVGYCGVAFLESPGNPYDGIDNDNDWDQCNTPGNPPQFNVNGGTGPYDYDPATLTIDPQTSQRVYKFRRILRAGDPLILIDAVKENVPLYGKEILKYNRRLVTLGNSRITVTSLGKTYSVAPGDTLTEISGNLYDDNLNGLIDEDYNLHVNRTKIVVDIVTQSQQLTTLPPLHYKDYINLALAGRPLNDQRTYPMIDERRDDGLNKNGQPLTAADPDETTDVTQSDQIGLTSYSFGSAGDFKLSNVDQLYRRTKPGLYDSLNFRPQDGDYMYGTGYFPLAAGQTERFSLALVYGTNASDVLKNKDIVQQIYDANYNFAKPPTAPILKASVENKKVTLYWDAAAEDFRDDFIKQQLKKTNPNISNDDPRIKTFEGYKIYRSSDAGFLDPLVITGSQGQGAQQRKALAQFDLVDGVKGGFPLTTPSLIIASNGIAYYLGSETGLTHTFTDTTVINGRTYFYGIVAYTKGDTGLSVYPSENSLSAIPDGRGNYLLGTNVVVVTPNDKVAGFVEQPKSGQLTPIGTLVGQGSVSYHVVDTRSLKAKKYRVEFTDTASDTTDNDGNGLKDGGDPNEVVPVTSFYSVLDITNSTTSPDTIIKRNREDLSKGQALATYDRKTKTYTADSQIFDGMFLSITYDPVVDLNPDTSKTGWQGSANKINSIPLTSFVPFDPTTITNGDTTLKGQAIRSAYDYEISIEPGSTAATNIKYLDGTPFTDAALPRTTNFKIRNISKPGSPEVRYWVNAPPSRNPVNLDTTITGTKIILMDQLGSTTPTIDSIFSWQLTFRGDSLSYIPRPGDKFRISTKKPLRKGDNFTFSTTPVSIDNTLAKNQLSRIRVVPNPYIVTSAYESALPVGVTRGRGERRIYFTHLPKQSTVRIYTIRGELVQTVTHDQSSDDGTTAWDLKSREGLDVAFGVYLYHVDAPGVGTTTGKFALIK